MVLVYNIIPMVICMKAIGNMVRNVVVEYFHFVIKQHIMENGKIIKQMEKVQ